MPITETPSITYCNYCFADSHGRVCQKCNAPVCNAHIGYDSGAFGCLPKCGESVHAKAAVEAEAAEAADAITETPASPVAASEAKAGDAVGASASRSRRGSPSEAVAESPVPEAATDQTTPEGSQPASAGDSPAS